MPALLPARATWEYAFPRSIGQLFHSPRQGRPERFPPLIQGTGSQSNNKRGARTLGTALCPPMFSHPTHTMLSRRFHRCDLPHRLAVSVLEMLTTIALGIGMLSRTSSTMSGISIG